jgi:hypothetical protein
MNFFFCLCNHISSLETTDFNETSYERLSIWLGNVSVNTTTKSHRLNFIVYRYMFRSSWDHHQAMCITNTIKLIEILIWIHTVEQRVYIIKVVENCELCYNENYNMENIRVYKNLYLNY